MCTLLTCILTHHYSTQAGQAPQRVRTTLVCTPRSADGRNTPFTPLYISARCEVQEPWVRLSTSALDFGGAYTGIPLQRHITVTNLSNLETRFRWERPGGRPHTEYTASFEPAAGALLGKQSLRVTITYTALTTSAATTTTTSSTTGAAVTAAAATGSALLQLEDVAACKVFGVAAPLGLVLRARHYGLTLSYDPLLEGQLPPAPLQHPSKTQWELSAQPPVPGPPVNFNFGTVPLLRRRTVQFCIRNLSAITAPFALSARKYAAGPRAPASLVDTPMSHEAFRKVLASTAALARHLGTSNSSSSVLMTASSSAGALQQQQQKQKSGRVHGGNSSVVTHTSSSSNSAQRADNSSTVHTSSSSSGAPLLSSTREAVEAFASAAGRERLAVQRAEREDMYALRHGRGIALLIEPAYGTVSPWGVCTVTVTLHNDMPGRYFDDIVCTTGPAALAVATTATAGAMSRSSSRTAGVHSQCSTDIIINSSSGSGAASSCGSGSTVVKLPVRCEVNGCPLSLKPESLGLSCSTVPHPTLSFTQVLTGGSGASRSLRVLNTGTCTAELTWRTCEVDDSSGTAGGSCGSSSSSSGKPLVDVQIGISETGAISVAISYSEKKPFVSPFIVEPAVGRVPPRGEVSTTT
jgi:hypothetical protein